MPTSLTAFFANFLVGAAAFPAVLFAVYSLAFGITWERLRTDGPAAADFLTAGQAAWLFTGSVTLACVIIGLFVDALGHRVLDEELFRRHFKGFREKVVPEQEKEAILAALKGGSEKDFKQLVKSFFYTHAPQHLFEYYNEQWSYYEFCRNAIIVSLLYLVVGDYAFLNLGAPGVAALWTAFWAGVTYIMASMSFNTIRYYFGIETGFVIGWFKERGLPAEPSGKGAREAAPAAVARLSMGAN